MTRPEQFRARNRLRMQLAAMSIMLSPQALAAHHSNTSGFRVAYRRRAAPLQPPLRPNRVEMRDATFCFCPTGFGVNQQIKWACITGHSAASIGLHV